MKVYTLTIVYNDKTEEVEYLSEVLGTLLHELFIVLLALSLAMIVIGARRH